MQANGNATQWPDGYPGRIDAEEDIARGHCFLVTDEAGPLAVFSFAPGPEKTGSSELSVGDRVLSGGCG